MSRSAEDIRFGVVEDAVTLLQMLPRLDEIVWPTEEGDVEAVAEWLKWLAAWAPPANAAFKRHRRELRASSHGPSRLAAAP